MAAATPGALVTCTHNDKTIAANTAETYRVLETSAEQSREVKNHEITQQGSMNGLSGSVESKYISSDINITEGETKRTHMSGIGVNGTVQVVNAENRNGSVENINIEDTLAVNVQNDKISAENSLEGDDCVKMSRIDSTNFGNVDSGNAATLNADDQGVSAQSLSHGHGVDIENKDQQHPTIGNRESQKPDAGTARNLITAAGNTKDRTPSPACINDDLDRTAQKQSTEGSGAEVRNVNARPNTSDGSLQGLDRTNPEAENENAGSFDASHQNTTEQGRKTESAESCKRKPAQSVMSDNMAGLAAQTHELTEILVTSANVKDAGEEEPEDQSLDLKRCPASDDEELPGEGQGLVLTVECGINKGLLYMDKLMSGSKGACVLYDKSWFTPNEFQYISGRSTAKDWKRSIKHYSKSLKLLMAKGVLKVSPTRCDCEGCIDRPKAEVIESVMSEDITTDSSEIPPLSQLANETISRVAHMRSSEQAKEVAIADNIYAATGTPHGNSSKQDTRDDSTCSDSSSSSRMSKTKMRKLKPLSAEGTRKRSKSSSAIQMNHAVAGSASSDTIEDDGPIVYPSAPDRKTFAQKATLPTELAGEPSAEMVLQDDCMTVPLPATSTPRNNNHCKLAESSERLDVCQQQDPGKLGRFIPGYNGSVSPTDGMQGHVHDADTLEGVAPTAEVTPTEAPSRSLSPEKQARLNGILCELSSYKKQLMKKINQSHNNNNNNQHHSNNNSSADYADAGGEGGSTSDSSSGSSSDTDDSSASESGGNTEEPPLSGALYDLLCGAEPDPYTSESRASGESDSKAIVSANESSSTKPHTHANSPPPDKSATQTLMPHPHNVCLSSTPVSLMTPTMVLSSLPPSPSLVTSPNVPNSRSSPKSGHNSMAPSMDNSVITSSVTTDQKIYSPSCTTKTPSGIASHVNSAISSTPGIQVAVSSANSPVTSTAPGVNSLFLVPPMNPFPYTLVPGYGILSPCLVPGGFYGGIPMPLAGQSLGYQSSKNKPSHPNSSSVMQYPATVCTSSASGYIESKSLKKTDLPQSVNIPSTCVLPLKSGLDRNTSQQSDFLRDHKKKELSTHEGYICDGSGALDLRVGKKRNSTENVSQAMGDDDSSATKYARLERGHDEKENVVLDLTTRTKNY